MAMNIRGVNLNKEFKKQAQNLHYFDDSLSIVRMGLAIGIFLFALFGLFDSSLLPNDHTTLYVIRYGFVVPGLFACFLLTFVTKVSRYIQLISFAAALIAHMGMLACMAHTEGNQSVQFIFFVALILLTSFCPMILALNTFFTTLTIATVAIAFTLLVNKAACVEANLFECTLFLEQLALLFTAGLLGCMLQFIISKLQQKDKYNIIQVTRQKRQLERSSESLKKSDDIKNKLLSIISHDVKGPLASIRGILNLYADNLITAQEFKHHIKRLDLLINGTGSLLDNLLYWSIYNGDSVELALKDVNVHAMVTENMDLYIFAAENKSIRLINEVDKALDVELDKPLINLVLRNLISNSVKFTENGHIIISAKYVCDTLHIVVKDTGEGIHPDKMKELYKFTERSSTIGTRNETGTGLGLVICKEFIEKHNGKMLVYSKVDVGTTITITLPVKEVRKANTQIPVETLSGWVG
jgi:signal transduction histidine kinase